MRAKSQKKKSYCMGPSIYSRNASARQPYLWRWRVPLQEWVNFFFLSSLTQQRGYVIATTQFHFFSFPPPFSTAVVFVSSTVLLEFPFHPQEFPNLPTPMASTSLYRKMHSIDINTLQYIAKRRNKCKKHNFQTEKAIRILQRVVFYCRSYLK